MKSLRSFVLVFLSLVLLGNVLPARASLNAEETLPHQEPGLTDLPGMKYEEIKTELSPISRYIVQFEASSLMQHIEETRDTPSIQSSPDEYLQLLNIRREQTLSAAESVLKRSLHPVFTYDTILSAASLELDPAEVEKIRFLPGVKAIYPVRIKQPVTDAGPNWVGAPGFWTGMGGQLNATGSQGEGVIIGVLDTGINFDHPSFSDQPEDGFQYQWDKPFLGVCAPLESGGLPEYQNSCNKKLIGGYSYVEESLTPEDNDLSGANGHGTHTASTAGGNRLKITYNGIPLTISGVASHAQIIAYDVCRFDGCYTDAIIAAIQQAVVDGVDVINYSISGGSDPYNDPVELAFLDAFGAGVFVSAAAGNININQLTREGNVNHVSPWVTTVAASTHDRIFSSGSAVHDPAIAGQTASFSLSGPAADNMPFLKPDLTAPGVRILAGLADFVIDWDGAARTGLLNGTSMSTPHVAGAAALLKSHNPELSPAAIKSMLMLTSNTSNLRKPDNLITADPFDVGSGSLDLRQVPMAGLVMEETRQNFLKASPYQNAGFDLKQLNLPSLQDNACTISCEWTREFRSIAPITLTYTVTTPSWLSVSPNVFTIPPNGRQSLLFTADIQDVPLNGWLFGEVKLETNASLPSPYHFLIQPLFQSDAGTTQAYTDGVSAFPAMGDLKFATLHLPVAVLPALSNIPDEVFVESHRSSNAAVLTGLRAISPSSLSNSVYGLIKGQSQIIQIKRDNTNFYPYDDLSQVWTTLFPLSSTPPLARLVFEIIRTDSYDLDIYWGYDLNGNGLPDEDEEMGYSASSTALESIDLVKPSADYDLWILVQNWNGTNQGDDVEFVQALVPMQPLAEPNLEANLIPGPFAEDPFAMQLIWHDIINQDGDRLYGVVDTFADDTKQQLLSATKLTIHRTADEVVKTVAPLSVQPGEEVDFQIVITNFDEASHTFTVSDLLPEGLTLVDGSLVGADYNAIQNEISWSGVLNPMEWGYTQTSSADDPFCTSQFYSDSKEDAYSDWESMSPEYRVLADPKLQGDRLWSTAFVGRPIPLFGKEYYSGVGFTSDGYLSFDPNHYSSLNQHLPDATPPNAIIAPFWDDLEVVYDYATNKGITVVESTSFVTIEYDDIRLKWNPALSLDMQVMFKLKPMKWYQSPDIIFAYDNISPGFFQNASGTIGLEDESGTQGHLVSYNDPNFSITNGSAICFTWEEQYQTHIITFKAVLAAGAALPITNTVTHIRDGLGVVLETSSITLTQWEP